MLQVKKLHFSRIDPILDGVSFKLKKGDFLGIVGPSGAGKSTLLKIIAGLLDPDAGQVRLNGERIKGPNERLLPGHPEIQLVNQDFALDRFHTVSENLRLQMTHLDEASKLELSTELLNLMELSPLKDRKADELSGGEQQRLALARALAREPEILLLDEPFAHIDAHLKRRITAYLLALKKVRKTSFILVSHDGQEVLSLADEIAFFDEGKIVRQTDPKSMYNQPKSEHEALFFGPLNVIRNARKTVVFRPHQYQTQAFENCIVLDLKYKGSEFYGLVELEVYSHKGFEIVLTNTSGILLNQIFISNQFLDGAK